MTNLENKLYSIASQLYENGGFITKPYDDFDFANGSIFKNVKQLQAILHK